MNTQKNFLQNLQQNANETVTDNGAKSYISSLNTFVDFFFTLGSSRGKDISPVMVKSFAEDKSLAYKIALYMRDIREGQGERQQFKNFIKNVVIPYENDELNIVRLLHKIVELGRFDDLEAFVGSKFETLAMTHWVEAIKAGNMLAAKWAPVKDKKGAKPLRSILGMNEVSWRKFVVPLRTTVEQQMCAHKWDEIEFGKLPSLAHSRYMKAFNKRCGELYAAYKESLVKGEAKINAGALYPYDVIKSISSLASYRRWSSVDKSLFPVIDAQWKALPDFVPEGLEILPIIDVSGSMTSQVPHSSVSCLDVALSLGLYISERNKGIFKDYFMSFSNKPRLIHTTGTISQRIQQAYHDDWAMSTNIEAVFNLILNTAVKMDATQESIPSLITIISDMQFNCVSGGNNKTIFEAAKEKYSKHGYNLPKIVFWGVNSASNNTPVTFDENGTALVSGFSPSIVKSFLSAEFNPVGIMLEAVDKDRYTIC